MTPVEAEVQGRVANTLLVAPGCRLSPAWRHGEWGLPYSACPPA